MKKGKQRLLTGLICGTLFVTSIMPTDIQVFAKELKLIDSDIGTVSGAGNMDNSGLELTEENDKVENKESASDTDDNKDENENNENSNLSASATPTEIPVEEPAILPVNTPSITPTDIPPETPESVAKETPIPTEIPKNILDENMENEDIEGDLVEAADTSGKCGDNLEWTLEKETLTITGVGDMWKYQYQGAPWNEYINDIQKLILQDGINSIGNYAFWGCNNLAGTLKIPNSVTDIGDYAFTNCSSFTGNLVIPDSISGIGNGAFADCTGFTGNLALSNNITYIGISAFSGCNGLKGNLIIPDSVTYIDDCAFMGCSSFTGDLSLSDKLTFIGEYAFSGCTGLTGDLIIPDSILHIKSCAFEGCNNLINIKFLNPDCIIDDDEFTIPSNAIIYGIQIQLHRAML